VENFWFRFFWFLIENEFGLRKMESISQLKQRADKLYCSRVESQWESLKEVSSVPKIDKLSRKVAELVTQKELEVLGIKPSESPSKKPLYSISNLETPLKSTKKTGLQPSQDIPRQSTPEMKSEVKVVVSSLNPLGKAELLNTAEVPASSLEEPKDQQQDPSLKPEESGEKAQESPEKHVEMLNNLEHIEAFKEELHRDYPELGLNNSVEGSSFHTNELHELEEACKEMNAEKSDARLAGHSKGLHPSKEEKQELEKLSNMTDHGSLKVNDPQLLRVPSLSSSKDLDVRGQGFTDSTKNDRSHPFHRNRSDGFIGHSKTFSLTSENKDFNLQNSYLKASFLHSVQENVSKAVPRCHVNLATNKVSPIYFNVRVAKDSRVKNPNGLGPADCLRKLLLKNDEVTPVDDSSDIYARTSRWLKNREDKRKKIKEDQISLDLQNCTFDPFYKKKHARTNSEPFIKFSVSLTKYSVSETLNMEKPKNTLKYEGLSPADSLVRYEKGVDREKFRDKAKPMVNYRQINHLA
jgi:hypothetical protein